MNHFLLIALAASLNASIVLPEHPVLPERPSRASGEVVVYKPLMRLVRPFQLPRHCGDGPRIKACTAFVGERLDCDCVLSDGGWKIDARAQFLPVMFVTGPTWVGHEQAHVDDIRGRVESHLQTITLSRFERPEECRVFADRERDRFGRLMDGFKLESNAALH